MAPAGCFLRGILPRASFGDWRKQQRTRCKPNGCSGLCRFVRFVANRCGSLKSRNLRCRPSGPPAPTRSRPSSRRRWRP